MQQRLSFQIQQGRQALDALQLMIKTDFKELRDGRVKA
jgi:hypothetical protein